MIPNKIKQLRKKRGLSQEIIGAKLGLTRAGFSLKELGKRPITTDELEIIATMLGVTPTYFYCLKEKSHK